MKCDICKPRRVTARAEAKDAQGKHINLCVHHATWYLTLGRKVTLVPGRDWTDNVVARNYEAV